MARLTDIGIGPPPAHAAFPVWLVVPSPLAQVYFAFLFPGFVYN